MFHLKSIKKVANTPLYLKMSFQTRSFLSKNIFRKFRFLSNRNWLKFSNTNKTSILSSLTHRKFSSPASSDPKPASTASNDEFLTQFGQELTDHRNRTRKHLKHIQTNTLPPLTSTLHPRLNHTLDTSFEGYTLPHKIWTEEETDSITQTHYKPSHLVDWCSYGTVQLLRFTWDLSTGYLFSKKLGLTSFSYRQWLLRVVFLETVAGVPGMMFAMVRHLRSLRKMQRDYGWIHTLLEEAENERLHLLVSLKLYNPGLLVRTGVISAQFIMSIYLFFAYIINPIYCHRFVGYLEEEAVKTYTTLLKDIDDGKYPMFLENADELARQYWHLPEDATWRDVFAQIRADEANHRDVNHQLAPLAKERYAPNPVRFQEENKNR